MCESNIVASIGLRSVRVVPDSIYFCISSFPRLISPVPASRIIKCPPTFISTQEVLPPYFKNSSFASGTASISGGVINSNCPSFTYLCDFTE